MSFLHTVNRMTTSAEAGRPAVSPPPAPPPGHGVPDRGVFDDRL